MYYHFEEPDDLRTWGNAEGLIPDCEKRKIQEEASASLLVLEYVAEFIALVDACGQVSYYRNMRDFVSKNVTKAKNVAASYQHDVRYYVDQYNEWRVKVRRAFVVLSSYLKQLGYELPNESDFLNGITFKKDRRNCYRYYLNKSLERNKTISPEELELKYSLRLKKRMKK